MFKPLWLFLFSFSSRVLAGGEGEITWQKDGEDITDEDLVSVIDESSSKLVIKKATMQDNGKYTCLCEFDNGHHDSAVIQQYVHGT